MDVQLQHTQVSAAGLIEPLHVGTLLEALGRKINVPPTAFVARETFLRRSDDESARALELSDSQWSNVRRARDQTRITVRTEEQTTELALPLPPAPPGANPSVLVRSVVLVQDLTPTQPAEPPAPLDGVAVFATPLAELGSRAVHHTGWNELAYLLNWTPHKEQLVYGLRYVLLSDDPLVLNELRVYRTAEWDATHNHPKENPSPAIHVRALSSFRSDVGPGVPKAKQDEAASALQYAVQHTQQLQKSLDAIVPLHRDI
ncbi:uncharacterized protein MJAP1_000771 [Malassezia japonica]|uniref:Uncharacterized protein n=1 Tax=Malassezia japonica TaxID=223818 RepID=A0AAF0EZ13_9BASI|nr:uncharacterized protein MJAP1_000771 [Malassezia japonica]WFD37824.1 hypothetical protein MJAP1_000771 [Malassezia japonica]